MNAHDPDAITSAAETGRFDIRPGTVIELGGKGEPRRLLKVECHIGRIGPTPHRLQVIDIETSERTFIEDEALAYAMQAGRYRVAVDPEGRPVRRTPGPGTRSPQQEAYKARCRDYVDACVGLPRSRQGLQAAIDAAAAKRGDPIRPPAQGSGRGPRKGQPKDLAPSFTTVLSWIERWEAAGPAKGNDCFLKEPNPGNRLPRVVKGKVAQALAHVLDNLHGKMTAKDADKRLKARIRLHHPGEADALALPGLRTIQRRITGQDRFAADAVRFGPQMAERRHRGRYDRPRPELPLMEVECDFTPLDIVLADEAHQVLFGRANAISFRDRCTGSCLGLSIGFNRPSYASFLDGLRHAIYPKDLSGYPGIRHPWVTFGRFRKLYVDNEMVFIGHDIRNAAAELGFEIAEFRPGSPWLKGTEEKLQGDLNRAVSHKLPGSTFSNPAERKLYEEWAEWPTLTVRELRAYLTHWICDEYQPNPHEGLGFLSTLQDIPNRLWNERIGKVKLIELPPDDLFVALAGSVEHRCINTKGIRWDHIRYQSDAIDVIRTHPDHRNGREDDGRQGRRHHGTQYKVIRDPYDLGAVWVHDPYNPGAEPIRVPATRQDYAAGITLHQHEVFVANARLKVLRALPDPVDELMRAKQDVSLLAEERMKGRHRQGIQRLLAGFQERGARHHERATMRLPAISAALSAAPLDPRDPLGMAAMAPGNPDSPHLTPRRPATGGTEAEPTMTGEGLPTPVDRGLARAKARKKAPAVAPDDLETLRARKRAARGEPPAHDAAAPGDDQAEPAPEGPTDPPDGFVSDLESLRARKKLR